MSSSAHCSTDPTNYACFNGIRSLAAAILFAVLYVPLFGWYLRQAIARPVFVYIILTVFCTFRIAAFVTRALLAGSDSAGENLNFLVANQVIYSMGFVGLLFSVYTLILDREQLTDTKVLLSRPARLVRNRRAFHVIVAAAVALGITGTCKVVLGSDPSGISLGNTLRKVGAILFVILSVFVFILSIRLAYGVSKQGNGKLASGYAYILGAASLLLLIREVFLVAVVGKTVSEGVWYPLAAATEYIAVCLLVAPGLVPEKSELPR